ncbi:MAG: hypothetical protein OT477_14880 [Chloroflexi bacterium]|nr:hypothetical protein [Chloroflexota bacterium]
MPNKPTGEELLAAALRRRKARQEAARSDGTATGQLLEELRRSITEFERMHSRLMAMILDRLAEALSLSDVKALCLLVNLKYEEFPHQTLSELLMAVLAHADRHQLTVLLIDTINEHHPHVQIP